MLFFRLLFFVMILTKSIFGASDKVLFLPQGSSTSQTPLLRFSIPSDQHELPSSLVSLPFDKEFESFIQLLKEKSCTKKSNASFERLYSEAERMQSINDMEIIYKKIVYWNQNLDSLKKADQIPYTFALGIKFTKFTDLFHRLLANLAIRSANPEDGIITKNLFGSKEEDETFFKKWFKINRYILTRLESKGILTMPTKKSPITEVFFGNNSMTPDQRKLCERASGEFFNIINTKLVMLHIDDETCLPFVLAIDKKTDFKSLHVYINSCIKDGLLTCFALNGELISQNGFILHKESEDLSSIYSFSGAHASLPLRKNLIREMKTIPESYWGLTTFNYETILKNRIGFIPFYENNLEKKYLEIAHLEATEAVLTTMIASKKCLEYQGQLKALEYNPDAKQEAPEETEISEIKTDNPKDILQAMETKLTELQDQRIKAEKELQGEIFKNLIAEEQEKRSKAVVEGKTQGAKSTKGKKGKQGKKQPKKTEQRSKQLLPAHMKAELEKKACEIVEQHKQKARCKLHTILSLLNTVSKEVDEVACKYGLPEDSCEHASGKGSHTVLHYDEGALLPFALPHSGRKKDSAMEASHINAYVEHYVDLKLLQKAKKYLE